MYELKPLAATFFSALMLSLGPAATATSLEAPHTPTAVLSSAELEAFRVGAAGTLPPNCEVIEDMEGVCLVIVCYEPNATLYPCDAFGH